MCQNFFSSPLYVREFFWDDGLVQEFFSYAYSCLEALTESSLRRQPAINSQDIFFQNHPPPPSLKLNGWPLISMMMMIMIIIIIIIIITIIIIIIIIIIVIITIIITTTTTIGPVTVGALGRNRR